MQIKETWLWGGGGALIGLLLGIAIAGDGREAREMAQRGQQEIARSVAAVEEAVGRIDAAVADLGSRVAGIESSVATVGERQIGDVQGLAQLLEEVEAGIDAAVTELGSAVSGAGASVATSLAARLEHLRAVIDSAGPGTPAPAGEQVGIGETVILADGAIRVLLSEVDPEGGTARVAVNGAETILLALGQSVEARGCTMTLTGVGTGDATIVATC